MPEAAWKMTETDKARLEKARDFAAQMHAGQYRIGGDPYITHPEAVADIVRGWGYGTDYQIAALFHDLLEDTPATGEQIEQLGGPEVLEAVRRMTKESGYEMHSYIQAIRDHPIAFVVKGADRLHNLQCAVQAGENFRRRYVRESTDWYLDFAPEIPEAVRRLSATLPENSTGAADEGSISGAAGN